MKAPAPKVLFSKVTNILGSEMRARGLCASGERLSIREAERMGAGLISAGRYAGSLAAHFTLPSHSTAYLTLCKVVSSVISQIGGSAVG